MCSLEVWKVNISKWRVWRSWLRNHISKKKRCVLQILSSSSFSRGFCLAFPNCFGCSILHAENSRKGFGKCFCRYIFVVQISTSVFRQETLDVHRDICSWTSNSLSKTSSKNIILCQKLSDFVSSKPVHCRAEKWPKPTRRYVPWRSNYEKSDISRQKSRLFWAMKRAQSWEVTFHAPNSDFQKRKYKNKKATFPPSRVDEFRHFQKYPFTYLSNPKQTTCLGLPKFPKLQKSGKMWFLSYECSTKHVKPMFCWTFMP